MAQKRTLIPNNSKTARKRKLPGIESLDDFPSKTESCNRILNAFKMKNKIILNNNEKLHCKSRLNVSKELNFDKNSDKIIYQSPSGKCTDQLSKPSSSLTGMSDLKSIIDKVRNLQILPSIHIYSIMLEGKGISAVDVNQNLSHFAYSFPHSHEIHLCSRNSLSGDIAREDLRSTWLNFESARNELIKVEKVEKKKANYISSPQEYVIRHDDISGLRFSSDDNFLLSCSLNGSVKVISTTTYRVLEHYDGIGSYTDIDINTSTTQFATTSVLAWNPFHIVYLYSFERKSPIQCLSGHTDSLKCVRFHPNGLYVATAACDRTIKLWDVKQAKEVRSFSDEGVDHPEKITFSPDGKFIASTHSGCVKIWDIASGRKLKCLETSNSESCILNICYNFEGSMLAAGGSDKKIHIWNIMSNSSSEGTSNYNLLKSECIDQRIFSIKYVANFFSCVTG